MSNNCTNSKLIQNLNEILDRYRKADPLLSPISPEDILKIQRALDKYIAQCNICTAKASGDYICLRIAANNMIRSLPMINKNIYPWRNYDWDYTNFIEKNYYTDSTNATRDPATSASVLKRNIKAINKLLDGYLTDPIPNKDSKAGGGQNKNSDDKDCSEGGARHRCLTRNEMTNLTPNEIPSTDDFFKKKLDGIYSSSYYVKTGSCPRPDVPTKTECNNKKYSWTPNTTGKIISTLSGCKDGCGCIRNKNTTCSSITKKGACIGSCKWDETDATNPKCIRAPASCDGWNRVDCKGKCKWDTVLNKCVNKLVELQPGPGPVANQIVNCALSEKDECKNTCEWSDTEEVCKKKNMECGLIIKASDCIGTCKWSGGGCINKILTCSDRTQKSCKGGCEWKYLTRDNDGTCGQPKYMFIDNSSKPFVNGSQGKGILPSMANDLIALSPDKLFAAATGNSAAGAFEQQQCPTVVQFSFKTALGGFTRSTFTIPAQDIYKEKLADILTIVKNGKSIKPGIQLDLIHNQPMSIWITVVISVIASVAKDMNTKLMSLRTLLTELPSGVSACPTIAAPSNPAPTVSKPDTAPIKPEVYVSEPCKITIFKKNLKEKFLEKKVYYNERSFDNLDIDKFTTVAKCISKCSTVEKFTGLSVNSKVHIQINKTVLICLTILIFILFLYIANK